MAFWPNMDPFIRHEKFIKKKKEASDDQETS